MLKKSIRLALISLLLSVTSCAAGSVDSFCVLYNPVHTDDATPEAVQLEIDDNNLAWVELCD